MVLAVDIGNTSTSFGLFVQGRLKIQWAIPSYPLPTPRGLARQLSRLTRTQRRGLAQARQVILCSVVPRMSLRLSRALRSRCAAPIRIVGEDLRVPLKNRYRYPGQVGQDRLVGAYAAWRTYRQGCIVVDFGTAITIDVVTRAGEYLGGVIAPGPEIALEALSKRTALLPRVRLAKPAEVLGRDTTSSIRSGVLYGSAALCDALISRLKRRYAPSATVVGTGGASRLIASQCHGIDHLRPHLVLEGLDRLARLSGHGG